MAKILFFGRFSDLSPPLDMPLPDGVSDVDSLSAWLGTTVEGFAHLSEQSGAHVAVNKSVVLGNMDISDVDEIAFMSALSGG